MHNNGPECIVNMYFNVRSEDPKSLDDISEDDNETFDILSLYQKGLRNNKVRTILKSKIDDLELGTICDQTRNLTEAYGEVDNDHVINLVHSTSDMNSKIDDLSKKLELISVNYTKIKNDRNFKRQGQHYQNRFNNGGRPNSFQNNRNRPRFQGTCHLCGTAGHKKADCRKGKPNNNSFRQPEYNTRFNSNNSNNRQAKTRFTGRCFNCQLLGHRANDCRKSKHN